MDAQMIKAMDSHYQSMMDKHWIDILNNFEKKDLDSCISSIERYAYVLNQFNLVQKFKTYLLEQQQEKTEQNED